MRRWLSVGALTAVAALSLAMAPADSFAAASGSRIPAAERLSVRPAPHSATQPRRIPQRALTAPTCNDQWNVVTAANAGTNANNELNSVSAITSIDAWAVGDFDTGVSPNLVRQAQVQHWDGSTWSLPAAQPAPVGSGDNVLDSVTAVTTTNVWAVGYSKADNMAATNRQVLIEHYDGTAWTPVADIAANNPAGASNSLFGVKFLTATDIWAVGESKTSSTAATPLIEHYDGTSWTTQTPATGGTFGFLADVLPLSATDVWAAGIQDSAALIEHYNGTAWSKVPMPLAPTNAVQFLSDIAGVANDMWAVGSQSTSITTSITLTMHSDGTGWTVVPSPTPDLSGTLTSVRYLAKNDVWAAGFSAYSGIGTVDELEHTVTEHWDGNTWRQVASPSPAATQALFDIALASPSSLITVGFAQNKSGAGYAAATNLAADLCEPTPVVSSLNPDHGNSAGGQVVKVMGSGLAFPRSVKFGTVAATSFSADSDSQITAVAPAGTVGTMTNVTVTTMGGTSVTGAGNQYTFFGPGPWELAGGVLASGPAASTWGVNRLDAFVTGTDGVIYHRYFNAISAGWAWEALPGEVSTSEASTISTASGSVDVFIHGADNALWRRTFSTGAWSVSWQRIGGVIVGAPAAISLGSGNIAVFVQGTDNHLWVASLSGTTWTWANAGGVLGSGPAAVSVTAATGDAFVRGTDGKLWHWSSVGPTWTLAGGQLIGKPAVTARGSNLDVFVEGTDIGLWHWTTLASGGGWEALGGKLAAAPAAVSWGTSRLDVFVEGTDSALYHAWSTSSGVGAPWSWEGVGGKLMGSPAAVTWGVNRLDAFVRGADNHLWHIAFN